MKRAGQIFPRIVDRENLRLAFARAVRGKRDRPDVRLFMQNLEHNLCETSRQLREGSFAFGHFRQFEIRDPKVRTITAPRLAERIVHHAIMNICEPIFERRLIYDTYACRIGKGRVAALKRARKFTSMFRYGVKLDVRKYFDSIRHDRLLDRLSRVFKDDRAMALMSRIVHSFRGEHGVGLPIGSLMSQHFANYYLDPMDRFVKENRRCRGYVRYMDDMVIWADDRDYLCDLRDAAAALLARELTLELKEPSVVRSVNAGITFLGCRVFRNHTRLTRRSRIRFRDKLQHLQNCYDRGIISELELQQRATSVVAFARTDGVSSWNFRRSVIEQLEVNGH